MTSLTEQGKQHIEENYWFGNANQINSSFFNATTLKLLRNLTIRFRICSLVFSNKLAECYGFNAVTVTTS